MALRILEYTTMLYRERGRNEALGTRGEWPAVLPVVLYNGATPWTAAVEVGELMGPVEEALVPCQPSQRYVVVDERHVEADDLPGHNLMTAVVRLEQSRSPADLAGVVESLREGRRSPHDDELMRVFPEWVRRVMERFMSTGAKALPPVQTLEEVEMTLEERVSQWPAQWMQEGREQGLKQGLERGREQGLEHERALLRRMVATRFGTATAERVSGTLVRIADPERLAEVGEWLVRCETGEAFLARVVGAMPAESDPRGA